jgi:hypothetical protein
MCRQSQVEQTVPSTSTVPAPTTSAGSGTNSARTSPISGRSRSQRRLTVGWLTPKIAPAKAWVRFLRSTHTTSATEPNRPSAYGRPREVNPPPRAACTRLINSVSCSLLSPVIASYRNGSCRVDFAVWPTTKQNGRSRCPSRMTRVIHGLCDNCELASNQRTVRLTRTLFSEGL